MDETTIVQDLAATEEVWTYPARAELFVPAAVLREAVGLPERVDLVADGGVDVQQAVAHYAAERGFFVFTYPTDDYDQVQAIRAVIWTLSAIAIGVGLVTLALAAIDRGLERRRFVARQVAIGVPARTFRTSQILQVLVPLFAALVLAVGCGLLVLRGYVALSDLPQVVQPTVLVTIGIATATASVIVAALTTVTVRARITPDLLRQE